MTSGAAWSASSQTRCVPARRPPPRLLWRLVALRCAARSRRPSGRRECCIAPLAPRAALRLHLPLPARARYTWGSSSVPQTSPRALTGGSWRRAGARLARLLAIESLMVRSRPAVLCAYLPCSGPTRQRQRRHRRAGALNTPFCARRRSFADALGGMSVRCAAAPCAPPEQRTAPCHRRRRVRPEGGASPLPVSILPRVRRWPRPTSCALRGCTLRSPRRSPRAAYLHATGPTRAACSPTTRATTSCG